MEDRLVHPPPPFVLPPPMHPRPEGCQLSPEMQAYLDRRRHFRISGERDYELEAEQERAGGIFREKSKPLYLCDQSAVQIMVKAITEDWPSPLGAWVRQQLEAGYLWSCTAVDAVPGWKVLTPDPRGNICGAPQDVQRLLRKLRACSDIVAVEDPAEMFDTIQTYARVRSSVEEASHESWRRLVTANRAFEGLCLGSEERRSAALWELFLPTYSIRGGSGPIVSFVDDVHQEKPEGPPFSEGGVN